MAAGDGGMAATGLKALNKANRARLEAYQHLFYMLQVLNIEIKLFVKYIYSCQWFSKRSAKLINFKIFR